MLVPDYLEWLNSIQFDEHGKAKFIMWAIFDKPSQHWREDRSRRKVCFLEKEHAEQWLFSIGISLSQSEVRQVELNESHADSQDWCVLTP